MKKFYIDINIIQNSLKEKFSQSVFALLLAASGIACILLPSFYAKGNDTWAYFFFIPFGFFLFYISAKVFISASTKIEIRKDSISEIGLFKTVRVLYSEIKGYRRIREKGKNLLSLESSNKDIIIIDLNSSDIDFKTLNWINKKFDDLDVIDRNNEYRDLVINEDFGINQKARLLKFGNARKLNLYLFIFSFALFFWTLIFPKPLILLVFILILFPVIIILIIIYYKGLIKLCSFEWKIYPVLLPAFFVTIATLVFITLPFGKNFDWSNFRLPFALFSLLLFTIAFLFIPEVKRKKEYPIYILLLCAAYGYGATISLNYIFPKQEEKVYYSVILNKRSSYHRSSYSYYLTIAKWEFNKKTQEVIVSKKIFNQYAIGENAKIVVRKGLFNIPWYDIER